MAETLQISIEPFNWSGINLEQSFRLVEKYIPLQVCRAHSILPLKFHNHCLTLGIVDQNNPNVHLIIKKLLSRKKLNLVAQKLDQKTFQLLLSSFLNYQQTNNSTVVRRSQNEPSSKHQSVAPAASGDKATFVIDEKSTAGATIDPLAIPPIDQGSISKIVSNDDKSTAIFEGDIAELQAQANGGDRPSLKPDQSLNIPAVHVPNAPVQLRENINKHQNAPQVYNRLNLAPKHLNRPLDTLTNLPAKQLWQELLGRVLSQGIGRLYFENHANEGRILLSESGVMKEALYGLPVKTFYGVLNEFKRLAHIPPVPVLKAKKAEMEQYYLDERILLRLTIIPGKHGEEGTVQVLRGQALVFHQQKQMDDQGREALQLAQQLERKLRHIYLRSQINPSPLTALPELMAACDRLKAQLENIHHR
ncbi:hypothetical protein [[Limnothrix rosea] IAM M-220]|uniref:hypothetical protein n=1 Tax=[Limnothrix rosea] IAM M-220 TaxID=454133 RepID=UPI0009698D1A|nr:hypothetical protein [[Limnothrix rosea] IAM M-220]OKH17478.1 hypothetical protein NIES208_09050 [[Limnothrix rosea] IAM M-220]